VITDTDLRHDQVLLEPLLGVPQKLYRFHYGDLERMASSPWLSPLNIIQEEREVVETEGTVLLCKARKVGVACHHSKSPISAHFPSPFSFICQWVDLARSRLRVLVTGSTLTDTGLATTGPLRNCLLHARTESANI
jgi:hypothetical protein